MCRGDLGCAGALFIDKPLQQRTILANLEHCAPERHLCVCAQVYRRMSVCVHASMRVRMCAREIARACTNVPEGASSQVCDPEYPAREATQTTEKWVEHLTQVTPRSQALQTALATHHQVCRADHQSAPRARRHEGVVAGRLCTLFTGSRRATPHVAYDTAPGSEWGRWTRQRGVACVMVMSHGSMLTD